MTPKEAIIEATRRSQQHRDRYAAQTLLRLTDVLKKTEQRVRQSVLRYKSLGSLPEERLDNLRGLQSLQAELKEIGGQLKKEQSLLFREATQTAFKDGIKGGIEEFVKRRLTGFLGMDDKGVEHMARDVFSLVDRGAPDFLVNYNLTLVGAVSTELTEGLKNVILYGITTGKSVKDIVADIGRVVKDPDAFRQAGGRVFNKAQYRMEVIARTEILRAHNQGRIKFHRQVGVTRLEWMTLEDERVCPVCGPLDGRTYPIERFPLQPIHPQCRCTNLAETPDLPRKPGKPSAKSESLLRPDGAESLGESVSPCQDVKIGL